MISLKSTWVTAQCYLGFHTFISLKCASPDITFCRMCGKVVNADYSTLKPAPERERKRARQ